MAAVTEFEWRGRQMKPTGKDFFTLTDGVWRVQYAPLHGDWSAGLVSRRFALGSYGATAVEALEKHRAFCLEMLGDLQEALKDG